MSRKIDKKEDFNVKYFGQANSKIIGIDFDGTITLNRPYPEIAPLDPIAKKYLDKLNEAGFILVLWTARMPEDYEWAYNRCINDFGLTYIKKDTDLLHGATGKLIAKFYIDDRSYAYNKVPWKKLYKYLIKKYR